MAPKAFLKQYRGRIMTVAFSIAMIALGAIWYANRTCQHAAEGRIFRSVGGVPKNEVALVLGTPRKTPRGTPNLHFTQRIEAAVELYRSGKVKHLLVSGDNHVKGYDDPPICVRLSWWPGFQRTRSRAIMPVFARWIQSSAQKQFLDYRVAPSSLRNFIALARCGLRPSMALKRSHSRHRI